MFSFHFFPVYLSEVLLNVPNNFMCLINGLQAEGDFNAKLGITILGEAVGVEDEVVVTNSIVLPNKTLNVSVHQEIIL